MYLVEVVPNFSTGDPVKAKLIADCFRNRKNVALLNCTADADHNRCVVTAAGAPQEIRSALIDSARVAAEEIDLNAHRGVHPRIGALDVLPVVPLEETPESVADELVRQVGQDLFDKLGLPVYFYEKSASAPFRRNLADVRRGGFEGLAKKTSEPLWRFDIGEKPHPTAGAVAVGVRKILVAFNMFLKEGTPLNVAVRVAERVRFSGGGLKCVKALGLFLERENRAQGSMNLTDFTCTRVHTVAELVKAELKPFGAEAERGELIGLAPYAAIYDAAEYLLMCQGAGAEQCRTLSVEDVLDAAGRELFLELERGQILDFALSDAFGREIKI